MSMVGAERQEGKGQAGSSSQAEGRDAQVITRKQEYSRQVGAKGKQAVRVSLAGRKAGRC